MARKKAAKKTKPDAGKKAAGKKTPAKLATGKMLSRAEAGLLPAGYGELLEDLKNRVRAAQLKAAVAVNRELIQLYWDIGRLIVQRQDREGWGKSVVERLADDIQRAFPGLGGFSRSNVFRMRAFYEAYASDVAGSGSAAPKSVGKKVAQAVRQLPSKKVAQAVRQTAGPALPEVLAGIPWGHNIVLLQKLSGVDERFWYAAKIIEHGWSRAVLTVQIETDLYGRQGKAVTNFSTTLPSPQSDLAQQTLKDPYVFDFLTLSDEAHERDLEKGLVDHVQKFLLELGAGFAFVGRQVHMAVSDDDFYLDLLFYHLRLRCFVVIDLKMQKFTPEDAGKLNFYLSAVDSQLRHPDDEPAIGLVLCKTRDRVIAEYALRDINKPIGVAEWQTKLVHSLPEPLRSNLPTIEQIEEELGGAK
jgi:predicted nuclease of restriction endonuclease-like (RecB) superfamily